MYLQKKRIYIIIVYRIVMRPNLEKTKKKPEQYKQCSTKNGKRKIKL